MRSLDWLTPAASAVVTGRIKYVISLKCALRISPPSINVSISPLFYAFKGSWQLIVFSTSINTKPFEEWDIVAWKSPIRSLCELTKHSFFIVWSSHKLSIDYFWFVFVCDWGLKLFFCFNFVLQLYFHKRKNNLHYDKLELKDDSVASFQQIVSLQLC